MIEPQVVQSPQEAKSSAETRLLIPGNPVASQRENNRSLPHERVKQIITDDLTRLQEKKQHIEVALEKNYCINFNDLAIDYTGEINRLKKAREAISQNGDYALAGRYLEEQAVHKLLRAKEVSDSVETDTQAILKRSENLHEQARSALQNIPAEAINAIIAEFPSPDAISEGYNRIIDQRIVTILQGKHPDWFTHGPDGSLIPRDKATETREVLEAGNRGERIIRHQVEEFAVKDRIDAIREEMRQEFTRESADQIINQLPALTPQQQWVALEYASMRIRQQGKNMQEKGQATKAGILQEVNDIDMLIVTCGQIPQAQEIRAEALKHLITDRSTNISASARYDQILENAGGDSLQVAHDIDQVFTQLEQIGLSNMQELQTAEQSTASSLRTKELNADQNRLFMLLLRNNHLSDEYFRRTGEKLPDRFTQILQEFYTKQKSIPAKPGISPSEIHRENTPHPDNILSTTDHIFQEVAHKIQEKADRYKQKLIRNRPQEEFVQANDLSNYRAAIPVGIGEQFQAVGIPHGDLRKNLQQIRLLITDKKSRTNLRELPLKSRAEQVLGNPADSPDTSGPVLLLSHPHASITEQGVAAIVLNDDMYDAIGDFKTLFPDTPILRASDLDGNKRKRFPWSRESKPLQKLIDDTQKRAQAA